MEFVSDPAIAVKIRKMQQRVRWQDPLVRARGIDQTSLVLEDQRQDQPDFSFLVVGDSGAGPHLDCHPQRAIAEQMLVQGRGCRFILHTGDVIYLVGSSEYYSENFIQPYREFIVGGERPHQITYDQMVFKLPFLPVPGNHDYYDLPLLYGLLSQLTLPLRRLLRFQLDFDVGRHGSVQGKAYAFAFLDCLCRFQNDKELIRHLERHYTGKTSTGRCLQYYPGEFTRLPNRYYSFQSGGIDFFALDSNTWNAPAPLPETATGDRARQALLQRQAQLEQEKQHLMELAAQLQLDQPNQAEQLDDLHAKLEQIEEQKLDVDKQLQADQTQSVDLEQLQWLEQRLIESWHRDEVRGRVLYLHHPPYVTEVSKWDQAQTLMIRHHLRRVLDRVAAAVGTLPQGQPLVDLVLTGHAHCLEYLQTLDTGHGDARINWLICGGSGYSLRRQRPEGPELTEAIAPDSELRPVARSQLFIGRSGHGASLRRPYSFVRIDVQDGRPPQFIVRPFVAERLQGHWFYRSEKPLILGRQPDGSGT